MWRSKSTVAKHRWKYDNDNRGPNRVHGQVGDLPSLQSIERAAPAKETRVQPCRPRQVDEQNEVLAKRRHPVGREAELRDARRDGAERQPVDDERAGDEQQLQAVEEIRRRVRVARPGWMRITYSPKIPRNAMSISG